MIQLNGPKTPKPLNFEFVVKGTKDNINNQFVHNINFQLLFKKKTAI